MHLEEDNSVHLVTLSDGEHDKFGNSIQEKFPTNLKCHLKTKHYEQFKELQKRESNKKEKGGRAKRKSAYPAFNGTQTTKSVYS